MKKAKPTALDFRYTKEKTCAHCGKKFISHVPNGKYCKECRKVTHYRRLKEW